MEGRYLRLRARHGAVRCPLRSTAVDVERCQACRWAAAVVGRRGQVVVVCAARLPALLPLPD